MNSPFRADRISAAKIMVVGCGALGNEVLKNLALMGAEHIWAVDFDRVESGNLSRSVLFSREDALKGRFKVDVVAERLAGMNPRIEINTVRGDVAFDVGLGLIRKMDVVIGCVDNRWARYCINRLCMRAGVPWVDGGISYLEGTVRVFVPGKNCYACQLGPEGLKDLARRIPCPEIIRRDEQAGKAPTSSIIASVTGAVQVQEALKLLHPELLEEGALTSLCGRMFCFEGEHMTTRVVELAAWDDDCPVHDRWEPVKETAVTAETTVGQALEMLGKELGAEKVTIHLSADCFVDRVIRKDNNASLTVMLPGRKVAERLGQDPDWRGFPFSALYQHEYREIDERFPYKSLTVGQLGIPEKEVLHVSTSSGEAYMEMQ
ncbi:MAG: ThiF family adenylyltransferase [Bacteroidales bacterium]|nr:ThiF family adenylyltransferase [Bacteroidales bacterium]